jgi:hypothetical protein
LNKHAQRIAISIRDLANQRGICLRFRHVATLHEGCVQVLFDFTGHEEMPSMV